MHKTAAKITDNTRFISYPEYVVNISTKHFVNKLPRNLVESRKRQFLFCCTQSDFSVMCDGPGSIHALN